MAEAKDLAAHYRSLDGEGFKRSWDFEDKRRNEHVEKLGGPNGAHKLFLTIRNRIASKPELAGFSVAELEAAYHDNRAFDALLESKADRQAAELSEAEARANAQRERDVQAAQRVRPPPGPVVQLVHDRKPRPPRRGGGPGYFPLYPDWLFGHLAVLSNDQAGAYIRLILVYWQEQQAPPDDDEWLARVSCSGPQWKRKVRPVLERFFRVSSGRWHHEKIEHEIAWMAATKEKKRQAARSRWDREAEA